jgi:hypothetical protein
MTPIFSRVDRIRGADTKKRLRITTKKRVQKINPTAFLGECGGGEGGGGGGSGGRGSFRGLRTAILLS